MKMRSIQILLKLNSFEAVSRPHLPHEYWNEEKKEKNEKTRK
jgi:hypothetical protein